MTIDSGILAKVPGEIIGGSKGTFPDANIAAEQPTQSVQVHAGHLGMVRITYERTKVGAHKSRYWACVAVHAEAVAGALPK